LGLDDAVVRFAALSAGRHPSGLSCTFFPRNRPPISWLRLLFPESQRLSVFWILDWPAMSTFLTRNHVPPLACLHDLNIPSIALFALSSQRSDERDAAMVYDVYTNRGRKKSAAHIMLPAVHFLISIFSLFVLSSILLVDMMITSDVVHVMRNTQQTDP
jgi:hypothetical protein